MARPIACFMARRKDVRFELGGNIFRSQLCVVVWIAHLDNIYQGCLPSIFWHCWRLSICAALADTIPGFAQ